MSNVYLEKIAGSVSAPTLPAPNTSGPTTQTSFKPKKENIFLHTLGTEGAAIGMGLALKSVASKYGGGKFGNALANSKLGRLASQKIWHESNVGGKVLTGELGEYGGSIAGVYATLKGKQIYDNHQAKNAYLQKAASFVKAH